MALITIIIPAYNGERTIGKCLDSIIRQSYKKIEIMVINDGSSDHTQEICESYAKRDSRIRVLSQKNQGVSAARNTGIRHATGEYLAFVDADDYIAPDMIQVLYQMYAQNQELGLAICGYDEITNEGCRNVEIRSGKQMSGIEFLRNLFRMDSIKGFLCNKLFRAEIVKTYEIWLEETIYVCEDLLFCCQYGMHIQTAEYSEQTLYHYVLMDSSATRSGFSQKRFTALLAFRKMQEMTRRLSDESLNENLDAHYIIICIQLAKRILKQYRSFRGPEMEQILVVMKTMDWSFLRSDWNWKYKLFYIPLKIISCIKKSI
ncbi:MAG: glycosyltransferase family 2 protein [Lachnospiraceae bacterium]|nr:glycosyltransferase family 2 protein [Lachnospiraceae bacterium]